MKTAFAIALVALSSSAAWAGEPAAAPVAAVAVTPRNFCGQDLVAGLLLKTEIGQRLQREQDAAVEQALMPSEAGDEKRPTLPEIGAPPAVEAKAQAAEAPPGAEMPRGIDGKRLGYAWLLGTESGAQLRRSYRAALVETAGQAKLPPALARPRREMVSNPSKVWAPGELQAHLEARTRILNAPEGMGLGLK